MTEHRDPLDALRETVVPVDPDPAFRARLRARLESALLNPRGTTMSGNVSIQGDIAYASLWLPDAARADAFYTAVLGWAAEQPGPDRRRIDHLTPAMGIQGGVTDSTLFLCHQVDDLEAAIERVRDAGGQAGDVAVEPFGRVSDCVDNQGMRFAMVDAGRADSARPTRPGEIVYLTVEVPDSGAYRAFYGSVFGWSFSAGRVSDGWQVSGPAPMTGMRGGSDRAVVVPMFVVEDVVAAVEVVRLAGGSASEPEQQPYGLTSDCVDDQGMRFYLGQM